MNKKNLTVCGFLILLLAGCGIITTQKQIRGFDIQRSDVAQLKKGETTEKEVLKLFGPPTKVRETETGKEMMYEYAKSGGLRWNVGISLGGGSKIKSLIVWLNKQGVVEDYAFKDS